MNTELNLTPEDIERLAKFLDLYPDEVEDMLNSGDPDELAEVQKAWAELNGQSRPAAPSGPTDPLVAGLLRSGRQEADGSIILSETQVAAYLDTIGHDPHFARGLMQTLVGGGAEEISDDEILVPPQVVATVAPEMVTEDQIRVVGRRLPDGGATLTAEDVAKILKWDGNEDLSPEEWMQDMTNYGCVLRDGTLVVPPDLVDALALPVPAIPRPKAEKKPGETPSVAKVLGLTEQIIERRVKQVIHHDAYDQEMFMDLVEVSPMLKSSFEAGLDVLKTWPELAFDLWNLIYKVVPKIRDKSEIEPSHLANLYLVLYAIQTDGFNQLREMTAGSVTDSILGYEVLVLDVLEYIKKCLEEYERQKQQQQEQGQNGQGDQGDSPSPGQLIAMANQMCDAQDQLDQAQVVQQATQDMIDQLQQSGAPVPAQLQDALNDAAQQAKEAEDAAKSLQEQLEQAAQDLKRQLEQALNNIGENVSDEVGEVRKWVAQWGLGGGDRPNVRMSPAKTRQAIEKIRHNKDFQKFAKILGRFRNIALADVKKKSKKNGVAIKDVKVSNEIHNALAGEFALLGDKHLETEFYRKYAEGQLLTYVKENTDAKGKGPGIICFDMSGSMSGNRITWAEAVTLALVEVFQKQKRDVIVIAFDDRVRHVWVFEHDKLDPNMLLDIASISAVGGTNFEEPLDVALQAITGKYEHPKLKAAAEKVNLSSHKFKKADITFITDGDSAFSGIGYYNYGNGELTPEKIKALVQKSPFLKKYHEIKDDKEFVCRTVLINVGGWGASDATAKLFSDKIIKLDNISDLGEAKAAEIFADARGLSSTDDLDVDIDVNDDDDLDDDD